MKLSDFRKSQGLTLEQAASQLGLSPKSASWLCEIEGNRRDASVKLAFRIEAWSGGKVRAASVCEAVRTMSAALAVPANDTSPQERAA